MRGVFLTPSMAGGGIIDRHPGRGRQPSLQDGVLLGVKGVLVGREEGNDLSFGDAQAQGCQLAEQALHRHLSLDVLHQHEAHDTRAEVAPHLRRQRRDDLLAVRGHPALAAEANDLWHQEEILHGERLKAAAARARRNLHGEGPLLGHRRCPRTALPLAPVPTARFALG